MSRRFAGALILAGSLWACSERTEAAVPGGSKTDSMGGTVELGLKKIAYRPTTLSARGAVGGTILLQGVAADSISRVTSDSSGCAVNAQANRASATGPVPGRVLVWIDGIAAGKPLPEVRRETLVIEGCEFAPRLIAVATGTTINVMSRDRMTHLSRFYREGANEPLETIQTVDAGQVVPSERIASQPGIVEARQAENPSVKGYIAVFDHPYFAVTDERGTFKIDSLPPGTYTMKVWHERLPQPAEQRVVVSSGGVGRLELMLSLK